jgi:hypothetical protein
VRAVVDANVWVSGVLARTSAPARLVDHFLGGRFELVTSEPLLAEVTEVLARPHIALLEGWIAAVEQSGIAELQQFCAGLRRDWEAVVAGLTLAWSNGPTEGEVNRLKLLKRQMYGRAGFTLLRARVLAA